MTETEETPTDGLDLVRDLAIIHTLPGQLRALIVGSFELRSFGFGEYIVTQGEPGDAFYVIIDGLARVLDRRPDGSESTLDLLRPGDSFGETALLESSTRTRSVRVSEPATVARLDRSIFQALLRLHPQLSEMIKLQARTRRLHGFLRQHPAFARLPAEFVGRLLLEAEEIRAPAGSTLVREGDEARAWWVVEDGRLVAFQDREVRRNLRFLRTGDIFGELALLNGEVRSTSIETVSECTLLQFDADTFSELLEYQPFRARMEERATLYAHVSGAPAAEEPTDAAPAGAASPVDHSWGLNGAAAEESSAQAAFEPPRRFPLVHGIDEMDCGPSCVAMLCRAFGHKVNYGFIRAALNAGTRGTTLRGLKEGCERIGLELTLVKSSVTRIATLRLPAILHWDANHWVVLYKVDDTRVWLADPARGLRTLTHQELAEHWSGFAAGARPTERLAQAPRERLGAGWLLPFLVPHRRRIAIAAALALISAGGELVPALLSQNVVNTVIGHGGSRRVDVLVAVMAGLLLLSLVTSMVQRRILARVTVRLNADALDFLTSRLLGLPLSYFQARRTGDIERRLNGLAQLRQLVVYNGPAALGAALQLVVTLVIMFSFSWIIGLVFLATAPVYALLMRVSVTRLRPTFDSVEEAYGRHASKQIDAIRGIETVKTAGAEAEMRRWIMHEFRRLANQLFHADLVMMSYEAAVQLVGFLIFVLFLWIAALLAIHREISIGAVVAVNSLVLLTNAPIAILLLLCDRLQVASVLLRRLQDVLDAEPEQDHTALLLHTIPSLRGGLSLRNVSLYHPDMPNKPALADISLTLEPGMSLGLVGRSGSGKSTLLRCLAGLLVPTSGEILFDATNLRDMHLGELRRRIGLVLQKPHMFDDTVASNIALGEMEPDMAKVVRAAQMAAATEFIEELPLGYATKIGEGGIHLSGGQEQRVAIARALYHDPPVVLFDEATSALDSEAERAVKESLDAVISGRTAVIVAHRLSTIRDADVIGVLDRGRLVEWGTHEELMAREGLYFHLNVVQLGA